MLTTKNEAPSETLAGASAGGVNANFSSASDCSPGFSSTSAITR
jgi:hypothetical protein